VGGNLLRLRSSLEQEFTRIEEMRKEINRSQWRIVTGEILATNLEQSVTELIQTAAATELPAWQKKAPDEHKLPNFTRSLRELVLYRE
jgi:hypothetical protein